MERDGIVWTFPRFLPSASTPVKVSFNGFRFPMPLYIYLLQQCWGGVMVGRGGRVLPGLDNQTRVNTEYEYLPQTSKQHYYLTCSIFIR